MSLSRYAPHRLRARYLRALKALPVPVALPEPVDPSHLTVLGRAWICGRPVILGTLADAPRLWIAFTDTDPALIGYVTGLVVGDPDLWICEETHREWALGSEVSASLKRAAAHVWFEARRDCEG